MSMMVVPVLLFGLGYVFVMWPRWTFPDNGDVDLAMRRYAAATSVQDRTEILGRLLDDLRWTESNEMDRVVAYAFDRMVETYNDSGDEAILLAWEHVRIDAHYGGWVCAEYTRFTDSPRFWERYDRQPAIRPDIERMLSFAEVKPEIAKKVEEKLRLHRESAASGQGAN